MVCGIVGAVRSARSRYGISPKQELDVVVKVSAEDAELLAAQAGLVKSLARTGELTVSADAEKPAQSAAAYVNGCEVYCKLAGLVDFDAERARLEKEREKLQKDAAKVEKKLSNPGFLAKAAPEVIEKDKAKFEELTAKVELINAQLAELD